MVAVSRSTIVERPIEEVWAFLRDFNGHARWHPAVAESAIEDGKHGDQVGCVRRFRLRDGAELREQLLALSDRDKSLTYCILEAPLALFGYVATLRLKPVTDGRHTLWHWQSSFSAPPEQQTALARLVAEDIYEAGFAAARAVLENRAVAVGAARSERAKAAVGSARRGTIESQAIVLSKHGAAEELRWERAPVRPPGPGEVRIRHTAIGLNYIDVYVRTGLYKLLTPPGTPGMEAAGEVVDIGEGVSGILPGDRVAYACPPPGAYAEFRTMAADQLVVLPDDIDDETAAAIMLKGMSAAYLLHRTHRVQRGDTVLVHAAAGGVGLLLCQWAKHLGATVIGTVSSDDKARLARDNGCDYPIVAGGGEFAAQVMSVTSGRGCDVIYDAVGAATYSGSLAALAVRGHLVCHGQASGPLPPIDAARLGEKSATLSSPVLFHYTAAPAELRALANEVFEALRRGVIRANIRQRYPLASAAAAHRDLEARRTTGATVLLT